MGKPKKKTTRRFITKMMICSREWELWEDPKQGGSSFSHGDPMNRRRRTIVLGTIDNDPRYTAEMLIHEVLEIILSTDEKRYRPNWQQAGDHSRYLFVFDHDYFQGVGPNLLTALLASGMFELKGAKDVTKG